MKSDIKNHPVQNLWPVNLFFFDQGTDATEMGYMPLSGQFGYIIGYHAANEAAYNRTIAHEIAHVREAMQVQARGAAAASSRTIPTSVGRAFNLRHTFSNENSHYQLKGSTANLLDYAAPTATGLYKYQWDLIHDPESIWFAWMEEEEEGKSGISITEHIINRLAELKTEFDAEYLAVLHCEQCEKESATKILIYSDLLSYLELHQLKGLTSPNFQLKVTEASHPYRLNMVETLILDTKACFALYFKNDDKGIKLDQALTITKNDFLNNIIAPALYMIDEDNPSKKIDCTDELSNGTWSRAICPQENISNMLELITEDYLNNLITHLESCIQNQAKESGSNSNRIHNYTAYKFKNEKFVNDLLNGLSKINDPIAGTRHTSKAHLFITEGNVSEEIIKEINDFKVAEGEYKIWINKNIEGYWEYKTPLPENITETFRKINEQSENKYSFNDFLRTLQNQLNNAEEALDFIVTGIYEGIDWLGNGIRKARIPEYIFNCNDKKNYNPAYAVIYSYVSRLIFPVSGAIKDVLIPVLISQIDDPKIRDCVNSLKKDEVEFAIICGFWNGIIETVGSIPDLLKLVITPFTSKGRENFSKFIDNFKSFVKEDEQGNEVCSGMWCAIKTGMGEMFDPSKCCQFGEIIGEIAVPIVISFINPEALAAAVQSAGGKTLLAIIRTIKWMDKVADPALYASKIFKSLKMFRFVNQSLSVIRTQTGRLLVKIENGVFKATVLMNDLIDDVAVSMDNVLALTTPDGSRFIVQFSDNGVERTATILGHELLSSLRGVNKAKLAQLIKLVPDQSLFLNRLTKTGLEFENLNTFIDDLIKNADLLDEFNNLNIAGDDIRNIAESWEVLFTTGRDVLRKDPKLLKKLSDIISNNNFGENGSKWTKENFSKLFTNHKNLGYAGKVIIDDLGVENIVGITMSAAELLDVLALARQHPKPGMQKVLNDLCCNTDKKYIGSEYVLRYAKDHWTDIIEFEETVQDGARVIDIVASVKPYRRELKSWRNFEEKYKAHFIKEFIEDLKGVQNLDEMGWYFDLKGDLAD